MLHLAFGEVHFEGPETPEHLEVAIRLLGIRLEELRRSAADGRPPVGQAPTPLQRAVAPTGQPVSQRESRPAAARQTATTAPRPDRGRWFVVQRPRVFLPTGESLVLSSIEELRAFLSSQGLAPHPRGDASMLVWQVRNRLKLRVEAVPLTPGPGDGNGRAAALGS